MTTFVPPPVWSCTVTFSFINHAVLSSLDLSGLTLTGSGSVTISDNPLMTSITFPSTSWTRASNILFIQDNGITGTLATLPCTMTFSQLEFQNNSSMTSMSFSLATRTDRLRANGCDLGYVDIRAIFNDWDNITSINLRDNSMTAAEVNNYLVDWDGEVTSGSYAVDIAGSNAAPDTTSGGNNGSAAKTSLQGKGLTVTTS